MLHLFHLPIRPQQTSVSLKLCSLVSWWWIHLSLSFITDLKWWRVELCKIDIYHQLTPRGIPIDLGIFVDASTSWGIGIVIENKWLAFRLAPSWKIKGRNICWLETVAVELIVYILEAKGIHEATILVRSDNQGTIGSLDKGRSHNIHFNLSIRRTYSILCSNFISLSFLYVPSEENLADPLSRGELGAPQNKLDIAFKLPDELTCIFTDAY